MRISVVFADMDGTFLADDKSIPGENMRMLDELARRGIAFVPCTGRPVIGVPAELLRHEATHFAIGSNGAVVFDVRANAAMHVEAMSKQRVLALYERVRHLNTTFDLFVDGEVLSERARYEAMGSYPIDAPTLAVLHHVRTPVDLTVPQIAERAHVIEKVTCFWKCEEDHDALAQALSEVGGFSVAHGHPRNFELQAKGVSKGSALAWLCAHERIPVGESVAFGDEANDVPLLAAAGTGVAMANAVPEVVAQADCITGHNNEAGFAQFLRLNLD